MDRRIANIYANTMEEIQKKHKKLVEQKEKRKNANEFESKTLSLIREYGDTVFLKGYELAMFDIRFALSEQVVKEKWNEYEYAFNMLYGEYLKENGKKEKCKGVEYISSEGIKPREYFIKCARDKMQKDKNSYMQEEFDEWEEQANELWDELMEA